MPPFDNRNDKTTPRQSPQPTPNNGRRSPDEEDETGALMEIYANAQQVLHDWGPQRAPRVIAAIRAYAINRGIQWPRQG
ncbi:hypothetical protein GPALN_009801 [Globodera pallida]|nr:hypothetical protein GPALN_009801 [Globodera pallida]